MKVGIVGLGYVGIVTGAVLSNNGYEVKGVDTDTNKVDNLRNGRNIIYEPELESYLKRGNIEFSNDYSVLDDVEITFISVPTPTIRGKIDRSYVFNAAEAVSNVNKNDIVIKSTVTPGTASEIMHRVQNNVLSNPEFLSEGNAIYDSIHPDRVVIGGNKTELVENIWAFTKAPILKTTNENAELIKYASNAFLATKISFINEIANICEKTPNSDVEVVAKGMGYDRRIGSLFLKAGIGYGGSCFPKDTEALLSYARSLGEKMKIVQAAEKVNNTRIKSILAFLEGKYGRISGMNILQLGLSFKENTDDIRESPALRLYRSLSERGARVAVFDPKKSPVRVNWCDSIAQCLEGKDLIIIATEWPEFKLLEKMDIRVPIMDGRRILDPKKFIDYSGVGFND